MLHPHSCHRKTCSVCKINSASGTSLTNIDMAEQIMLRYKCRWCSQGRRLYLWYDFPFKNFTSGESHANEKTTSRFSPGGTSTRAAMAAPIAVPWCVGAEGLELQFSLSKLPFCKTWCMKLVLVVGSYIKSNRHQNEKSEENEKHSFHTLNKLLVCCLFADERESSQHPSS